MPAKSPCYLCAWMRRGHLYSKARSLGCNKIALGHHFSDVIETTVMGMFYGSQIRPCCPSCTHEFRGHGADPAAAIASTRTIFWRGSAQ